MVQPNNEYHHRRRRQSRQKQTQHAADARKHQRQTILPNVACTLSKHKRLDGYERNENNNNNKMKIQFTMHADKRKRKTH